MRVLPLACDAEPIRGIALTGQIDLSPVRRSEGIEMQYALHNPLDGASQTVRAPDLSDEALMVLLMDENSDALDKLFSRHSRLVYSIALRILSDAGEAEEVVQECFLHVFRKAFTFEPTRGSAKVWIIQVAYSRARDRKAQLSRRGFYARTNVKSEELDGTLVGHGDVEREIGAKVDFERLQSAFEDLSAIQRRTLELFYFQDFDLREISECLHEPLGNVRHHFYRGLDRLRKSAIAERLRNYQNGKG
jgi:RNA polymerase sigma-70 factor (ECF subfamily)